MGSSIELDVDSVDSHQRVQRARYGGLLGISDICENLAYSQ